MHKILAAAAGLSFLPGLALAQSLDDIAKAMGADRITTIEYAGTGDFHALGQSLQPGDRWPLFKMVEYKATINYGGDGAMIQRTLVIQGEHPPRGGGRQPVKGKQSRSGAIAGEVGWSPSARPTPARETAPMIHALWTSPHGVIKAALAQKSPIVPKTVDGKEYKTVAFARKGAFTAIGWFDKTNVLRGVDARVANPVYGDMKVTSHYSDYKTVDGIAFPMRIRVIAEGQPLLDLRVAKVTPNAPAEIKAPEGLRPPGNRVTMEEAAKGVWFVAGGSHNSVAIDHGDHVTVVEGPLNDGRSTAVIAAVKKTIPGKPIRFVVNSHHHFDHSGGLRGFVNEGATVVTHKINVPFYQQAYRSQHTVDPDLLAKSRKTAKFIGIGDKHVMGAGDNALELHLLKGSTHNTGLIVGYMPAHKILIVADAYSGRERLSAPVAAPEHAATNLIENIARLKLDIARVLPLHGAMMDFAQVRMAGGQAP
jgi:glyoxylase-like metal-dependent hydrolase (beta-lactamase superfamily II)